MKTRTRGNTPLLIIGLISLASLMTVVGLGANTFLSLPQADLSIVPQEKLVTVGDTFSVSIIVAADVPVNVFSGDLSFDATVLRVKSIDYNTSIADLWAERPWYDNGDGTITFAGGTTKAGGFTGEGTLINVTFETLAPGSGNIVILGARILQHDGLGTDAELAPSIDAIVSVVPSPTTRVVLEAQGSSATYHVAEAHLLTDLNSDGAQSIVDVSIFMTHLVDQSDRADFNADGKVGLADLSILLLAE